MTEHRYEIKVYEICNQCSYQIVGALADRAIVLVRAEAVITFHLTIVQGRLAGLVETIEDRRVGWQRTMGTTFARIGWYRVLAGLAHSRVAGRGAVLVAGAGDAVALLPFLAEFPRDALVQTVLRLLLGLCPEDRICGGMNERE